MAETASHRTRPARGSALGGGGDRGPRRARRTGGARRRGSRPEAPRDQPARLRRCADRGAERGVPRRGAPDQRDVLARLRPRSAPTGGAGLSRRSRAGLRDLRTVEAASAGMPSRRSRRASGGARAAAPARPRSRRGHAGRGDGGDRDENTCQPGDRRPIYGIGAPLWRRIGQETWAILPTGTLRSRTRLPKTETRKVPESLRSLRGSSGAILRKTTILARGPRLSRVLRAVRARCSSICATCVACGSMTWRSRVRISFRCPSRRRSRISSPSSMTAPCRACRSIARRSTSRWAWCT